MQKQIRYIKDYGENETSQNVPQDLTAAKLVEGLTGNFQDLSISCLYGTKFYINDTSTPIEILPQTLDIDNPLTKEATTWQDTKKIFPIYKIRFTQDSINKFLARGEDYLIINFVGSFN